MNIRRTVIFLIPAFLAGLVLASAPRGQVASQSANLSIFFTGDHNGEVAPCGCPQEDYGGITRQAAFLDTLRTSGWKYLTLDAGDLVPFEGLNSQGRLKVETLARGMAGMEYDAITLGDRDLEPGPEWVDRLLGWLGQPVLATNYDLPGSERTRVVKVRGLRVGLVAFLDPAMTGGLDWLEVEPWEDQRPHVKSAREGSDVLVALVHAPDGIAVNRFVELYPETDLVLAAHDGVHVGEIERVGTTYIAGTAARGRYLGRVEVAIGPDGKPGTMQSAYLPVVEAWGRRAWADTLLTHYYADMRKLVKSDAYHKEILKALEEPAAEYVGNQACMDCHESQGRQWQATAHAHARESLVSEDEAHNPECQPCHTTGFGFRTGFATPETTPDMWNVGCETCHGAGAAHREAPDAPYGEVSADACVSCHDQDNSPDFDSTYLPRVVHDED